MRKWCLVLVLILTQLAVSGQELHFRVVDKKIKVVKGDIVQIDADTAYVISITVADQLNAKLNELKEARITNEKLVNVNSELVETIKKVEDLTEKLLMRMENGHQEVVADFDALIGQLDSGLTDLKKNNEVLEANNAALQGQIKEMQTTIRLLKKEIRGIWWNGIADKVVTGAAGVAIGILITLI